MRIKVDKMKKVLLRLVVGSALGLTACGGGSDSSSAGSIGGSNSSSTSNNTQILALSMSGTSNITSDGTVPINPYENNRGFTLNWSVIADMPMYRVDFYFSNDKTLNGDTKFLGLNCGTALSVCQAQGTTSCLLSTSYKVACSDGAGITNIESFIDTLPKSGYMIMRACNGLLDDCVTQSIPVEFQ